MNATQLIILIGGGGACLAFLVFLVSLCTNGAWRAARRALRWPVRVRLEPTSFIDAVRLHRPACMTVHSLDGPEERDEHAAHRLFFDAEIDRMPVRYATVVPTRVLPSSGERTFMLMTLMRGERSPKWEALSPTLKALVRFLDNLRLIGYRGPATAFGDSYHWGRVDDPAAVSCSDPAARRKAGSPMSPRDVAEALSGR